MMKPTFVKIYSENNEFQHIETLQRNRVKRNASAEFFVEGVRAIEQALSNHWTINAFVYSRDKPMSAWANGILENSNAKKHLEVPWHLLKKLSQKEETSELVAIVAMQANDLARIPMEDAALVVVLDRPANPGNIGTIIRSCDAFQVNGVIITGHAADLFDPETIRATTGSFFSLPVVCLPSHADLLPWLEQCRQRLPTLQVIGTSARAQVPLQAQDFSAPTLLLIGNETKGLSQNYKAICDALVTIPMAGTASSLNVACAASILLYEIRTQRSRQAALHV